MPCRTNRFIYERQPSPPQNNFHQAISGNALRTMHRFHMPRVLSKANEDASLGDNTLVVVRNRTEQLGTVIRPAESWPLFSDFYRMVDSISKLRSDSCVSCSLSTSCASIARISPDKRPCSQDSRLMPSPELPTGFPLHSLGVHLGDKGSATRYTF